MTAFHRSIRSLAALALVGGLSACGAMPGDTVTRGAIAELPQLSAPLAFDIASINVTVPRTLVVSEKNRFYPEGDIVWRGDPRGDRYQQVEAIFREAMTRGTDNMSDGLPAVLDIEVARFHALTEKARYFTGGVHDITFTITLRDPATGQALTPPREIEADFKGLGGRAAIAAEQHGQTQKLRITEHLAKVIRQELTAPGSYHAESMGLMGLFNTL